ncbi:MAG TPA: hypothetical protein VJI32_05190 [Candidatus Nanoarchaeia archaeon]|nr:hypothetical protein [Candidatus Nanoarchaeia archaeon]
MDYPTLDDATKKALNKLTLEEAGVHPLDYTNPDSVLRRDANGGYAHEILWYGVDAITHVHLMRMARDISSQKLSPEGFVKKYNLTFEDLTKQHGLRGGWIRVPLTKIESGGIFIPRQAYSVKGNRRRKDRQIHLFDGDYGNRVELNPRTPNEPDPWPNKQYAKQLMNRGWKSSDLESPELVEQGIRFGKDMWQTCVQGFEWCSNYRYEGWGIEESLQLPKVTELGRKLIAYYEEIIKE